jgi:hypothetical protein
MLANIMKRAHALAKQMVGHYYARLSLALRQAWKEAKGMVKVIDKKAKFETKEEALQHISATNKALAAKQINMINMMYEFDMKVNLNDLENIALDCHQANMKRAMSY